MKIIKIDIEDEIYPKRLLKIKNCPISLYALGNISLLNSIHTIGIVGARRCTDYGRKVTYDFSQKLSKHRICIISGMVLGIDTIANSTCVEEEGKTIVIVTHSMGSILRFCTRAIWLHKGKVKMDGNVKEITDAYIKETA